MVELGRKVKDSITGFEGIAVARCGYLNGCVSVQVRPQELTEGGKMPKTEWIDEQQLDEVSEAKIGGPGDIPVGLDLPG